MCKPGIIAACALLAILGASAQDPPPAAAPKAEGKKGREKGGGQKKLDVRVKVAVNGERTLPSTVQIEISGQEPKCGPLSTADATAAIDDNREALFKSLPACKVSIKVNARMFMPFRALYNLADYHEPITITLQPAQ